jgi:tetratricopeptide (TPR) repeat protein
MNIIKILIISTLLWGTSSTAMADAQHDRLKQLIDAKQYNKAYRLAEKLFNNRAGQAKFDYLYALATNGIGKKSEAVFALQRVIMVKPDHYQARLALARIYNQQKDYQAAIKELDYLLALNPPANMQQQAALLLDEAENQGNQFTNTLTAYVSLDFGNDSNVNSAIETDSGFLVAGTTLLLFDESAESTSDNFSKLAGGVTAAYGLENNFFLFGGLDAYEKKNTKESDFDATLMSLFGGAGYDYDAHRITVPIYYQKYLVGHNAYLARTAISLDWQYFHSSDQEFGASVQYGENKFDSLEERDVRNTVLILGWKKQLSDELSPRMGVNIHFGTDVAELDIYDHYARNYTQLEIEGSLTVWDKHTPYAGLTYRTSSYMADDPLYNETRGDTYTLLEIGWRWRFLQHTHARVGYSYAKNSSNLELYEFDRSRFFVGVQYNYF